MPSLVLVHNPPKRDARGRFLPLGNATGLAFDPASVGLSAPAGRKRNPPGRRIVGVVTRDRGNVIQLAGRKKPEAWGMVDERGTILETWPLSQRNAADARVAGPRPAPAGRKRNPPKDATATELANTAELYGAKASLLSAGGYEIHMRPEHGGTYLGRFENREKAIRFLTTLKVPKRKAVPRRNAPRKGKQLTKGEAADLSRAMTAFDQLLGIVQQEYPELSADEQRGLAGRALTQLMAGGARSNPPNRAGVISRDVHEIKYRHAENGLDYFHPFTRNDVELIAMTDGTLRIRSRSGKPLWHNFPEGAR